MRQGFQVHGFRFQQLTAVWLVLLCSSAFGGDFASLCADRAAIERIYYNHRTGEKPPFDQTLPPAALEHLVRQDLRKEEVLKKAYGVEIKPAMLDAEVQRINTTTRAPEMLAEIKSALANDSTRFANSFAKPFLVERLLHGKYDNDDSLHAPQRQQVEQTRNELLAARTNGADYNKLVALLKSGSSNAVTETTLQLAARTAETNAPAADQTEIRKRFGPNAQVLSAPRALDSTPIFYFEDLPAELQHVLRVQLRRSGDISAVIETPSGFLLYVVKEKSDTILSVAVLSVPKRSYEEWIAETASAEP